MAGGNASPRQKMINMMYLVLTALLALNVSKEVLDAFVKANIALNQQNGVLVSKNSGTYNELSQQVLLNPKDPKYKQAEANANQLSQYVRDMVDYIEKTKVELLVNVDGVDEATAKELIEDPFRVNKKDDYDMPTNFFGTGEPPGDKGRANELKKKLQEFKDNLAGIAIPGVADTLVAKALATIHLDDPDPNSETVKKHRLVTWELQNFYHLPLSAALMELARWQNVVRGAEAEVLKLIWDGISANAVKFDAVEAKVVPKSTFVVAGGEFEADVFLAAYNTTLKPEIVYGSAVDSASGEVANPNVLDTTNINNGVGLIKVPASGTGERTFAGVINLMDKATGDKRPYPFQTKYTVSPPMASVAADKMNVFYVGLENPITVSVPGYAPENLVVTTSGPISVSGSNGKYTVKASNTGAAKVNVSVKTEDGKSISMGAQEFRCKAIPTPVVKWAGVKSGELVAAGLASQSPLIPEMENFDFEVYSKILSFTVTYFEQGVPRDKTVNGNVLPGDVAGQIRGMRRGQKVYFDDIVVQLPSGERRKVNAQFKIK